MSHASPVRALFVTHNVPRHEGDAAGSFVLRLAVALRARGVDVRVIAPGAPALAARDRIEGVEITRARYARDADMTLAYTGAMVEEVRRSWRGKLALARLIWSLRRATQRALADARAEGRPFDVVHAHWWFPAGLALLRALPPSTPLVVTMHGSDVRLAQGVAPARRLMRAVLDAAGARTAVSSWLADAASRIAPRGRIHVAPMPVAVSRFTPVDDARDDARDGVLFVGRLNAQKGVADLLRALSLDAMANVPCTIVGDGPDRAALEARAAALGVADRVRWIGAVPHHALAPYYQRAAVVVIPSTEEGLGLVAVEAQLCETPVVAYASGGLPDVVRMDGGGTLVKSGDVVALADAMAMLIADPARARALGREARTAMLEHFAPEEVADRYLAVYAEARESVAVAS